MTASIIKAAYYHSAFNYGSLETVSNIKTPSKTIVGKKTRAHKGIKIFFCRMQNTVIAV